MKTLLAHGLQPRTTMQRLLLLASLLVLLTPSRGHAQSSVITLLETGTNSTIDDSRINKYFNTARCSCKSGLRIVIKPSVYTALASGYLRVVVGKGTACLDPSSKAIKTDCAQLYSEKIQTLNTQKLEISVYTDANSLMRGACSDEEDTYTFFVYTDDNADNQWDEQAKLSYTVDTKPPGSPKGSGVKAGENLVEVSFAGPGETSSTSSDAGTSTVTDPNIKGYQVLCEKLDGTPGLANPPSPEYETAGNLCGSASTQDGGVKVEAGATKEAGVAGYGLKPRAAGDAGSDATADAGVVEAGAREAGAREAGAKDAGPSDARVEASAKDSGTSSTGLAGLDKAYVCSAREQSAGSVRVSGLENGVAYRFHVISIDLLGNPSAPVLVGTATPELAEDLWERYKRSGGKSEGGYCFVATAAYGSYDHPQVRVLRDFRDEVLLRSRLGRIMVTGYYEGSPGPARFIAAHPSLRPLARALLWPLTIAAGGVLYTSPGGKLLLLGALALMLALLVRRSRAGGRP
jgi:hypothetical protein